MGMGPCALRTTKLYHMKSNGLCLVFKALDHSSQYTCNAVTPGIHTDTSTGPFELLKLLHKFRPPYFAYSVLYQDIISAVLAV